MSLELKPISASEIHEFLMFHKKHITSAEYTFGVSVIDNEKNIYHGTIVMLADGKECSLVQLYTDGTALVGSILYGAAWRAAKALGYKKITI